MPTKKQCRYAGPKAQGIEGGADKGEQPGEEAEARVGVVDARVLEEAVAHARRKAALLVSHDLIQSTSVGHIDADRYSHISWLHTG